MSQYFKTEQNTTENSSEIPNNCETCLYRDCPWDAPICDSCTMANSHYERDEFAKDTNVRSKPNDCKYAVNPSGDVWECGCCLEIFCEHQIYDRNPDGTLNIVECGFEPKTEPQTDCNRYVIVNGEGERVYDCIGCMTDCAWGRGEEK